jgi:hypothetical protein
MIAMWKALWVWLAEKKILWLTLGVASSSVFVAFVLHPNETGVRRMGWVLELLGLGTVAWDIHQVRQEFGQPGFFDSFLDWLRRMPGPWQRGAELQAHIRVPGIRAHGRLSGWHELPSEASLEVRLDTAERNLQILRTELQHTQREFDDEKAVLERSLSEEQQAREAADVAITQRLEAAHTGGLYISAMGLVWLAMGLTLSTIPAELLDLLK